MPPAAATNKLLSETTRLRQDIEATRRFYLLWLLAGVLSTASLVTGIVYQLRPAMSYEYVIIVTSVIISVVLAQVLNVFFRRAGNAVFVQGMAKAGGLRYNANGAFSMAAIRAHKIIPAYDDCDIEHGFSGPIQNAPVSFQEVSLSNLLQTPGHEIRRRDYTRFRGMLIRVQLQRRLGGHTVIVPRPNYQTFFRDNLAEYTAVGVPTLFDKLYNVVSTDPVEAKMIITPAFLERFMEASALMHAKWMEVSFMDNEILFAVQRGRPLFEIGHIWQPVTAEYLRKLADHMDALNRMIEALRHNRHVGL
ncbi:MAG: DUF3137 domain-containing protein [Alphaproteobacteria bacterium]|nr:DUF3137 domain-containing protein [Alphaproteobacteria bacterium]MBU0858945.1 DUF3137 domain-containing protein [Alphaproteobacteria bacterium]